MWNNSMIACSFTCGQYNEKYKLLRWRNPKKELPKNGKEVLLKVIFLSDKEIGYKIGRKIGNKLKIANQREECEIIGWRPIVEL